MAASASSTNLWELAYDKLPVKCKKLVEINSAIGPSDVLRAIEERKKDLEKQQWTIASTGSKRTLKLRDVFAKTAKWIEKFIEVGDQVVQYDPVHAALPWAAIRFILKASVNDVARDVVICEGIETISNIIVQCHFINALQQGFTLTAIPQRNESLVALYTSILTYLTKAKKYYGESTAKMIAKSIISFADKYEALLDKIVAQKRKVDHWVELSDIETNNRIDQNLQALSDQQRDRQILLQDAVEYLRGPINRMEKQLTEIQDGLQERDREEILRSLSTQPYFAHHEEVRRKVIPTSGMWLVQHPHFLQWQRSSESSILWLHGIPGSGKSCLASIVIDDHMDRFSCAQNPRPCYFYCTRNSTEKERADPDFILGSIARQLSCLHDGGAVSQPANDHHAKRKRQGSTSVPPTLQESIELIIAMTVYRPVTTIIIDALDECEQERRPDLLNALDTIITRAQNLVKVFVTSRNDLDIVLRLEHCPNLEVEASKNQVDIERFVDIELNRRVARKQLLLGSPPADLVLLIRNALCSGAQGMFRWVELQMQFLCSLKTKNTIEKRLGRLPGGLKKIYEEIYDLNTESLDESDRLITENIFRWLLCAQEVWRTDKLLLALSQTAGQNVSLQEALQLTFNLVIHDRELDVFRFAHLSVREFLEENSIYHDSLNHAMAAVTCLTLLGSPDNLSDDSFTEYAVVYWTYHTKFAAGERQQGDLHSVCTEFFRDGGSPAFCRWSSLAYSISDTGYYPRKNVDISAKLRNSISEKPQPLFCFCVWGFEDLLPPVLRLWKPGSKSENLNESPLLYTACEYGQTAIVQQFLQSGFDVNERGGSQGFALIAAANSGNESTVELLLNNGAKVDAGKDEKSFTALVKAASKGHSKVVKILLDNEADINAPTWSGTALMAAILGGHFEIVELLLSSGADVNIQDDSGASALQIASELGYVKTVELLLRHDANVNACGGRYGNALMAATYTQRLDVIEVLHRHGADVNIRNRRGSTPLAWASRTSNKELVKMLCDHGADVNAEDKDGYTSLHWASYHGNTDVVEILLDRGADVNAKDRDGETPLHVASREGYKKIFKILLKHGADVNVKYRDGETLLYRASYAGIREMVENLLDRGANMEARNKDGGTPLYWASHQGHNGVVEILLDHGADVNAKCLLGTSLHAASKQGYQGIVEILSDHGADVNAEDEKGETPIYWAAYRGYTEVVETLLDHGTDVNTEDHSGETPLYWASCGGYKDIVEILLNHGADINAGLERDKSALRAAKWCARWDARCIKIVDLLISRGARDDPLP